MISPITPSNEALVPAVPPREALVVSSDSTVVRLLQQIFGDLAVSTAVASCPAEATVLLSDRHFDGVIVDCDGDSAGAETVLRSLRSHPLTRWTIALALASDPEVARNAFRMGVNFTLDKPLNIARTTRLLQTARSLMSIPRRRATRVRVRCEAECHVDGLGIVRGQGVDLSEGGIAMQGETPLREHGRTRIRFVLPRTDRVLHLDAKVVWADGEGRAGLRFVNVTPGEQALLAQWVKDSPNSELVPDRRATNR